MEAQNDRYDTVDESSYDNTNSFEMVEVYPDIHQSGDETKRIPYDKNLTQGLPCSSGIAKPYLRRMQWNYSQISRLIDLYRSMPELWDTKSRKYKDRNARRDAFELIATEFGCTPYEVERKLRGLRFQFAREQKKLEEAAKSGSDKATRPSWFAYEHLMFLLPGGASLKPEKPQQVAATCCAESQSFDYVDLLQGVAKPYQRRMQWNYIQITRLIELYRSKSELWDTRCSKYKDRLAKRNAIDLIASEFGCTAAEVEKKIRGIRSQFAREQKKLEEMAKSGSGSEGVLKPTWFAYEHLLFLSTVGTSNKSASDRQRGDSPNSEHQDDSEDEDEPDESMSQVQEANVESQSVLEDSSSNKSSTPKKRVLSVNSSHVLDYQPYSDTGPEEDDTSQNAYRMPRAPDENLKEDGFATFGNYVAQELKSIENDRYSVQMAKHKINEILFKATTGVYRRCSSGATCASNSPMMDRNSTDSLPANTCDN